MPDRSNLLFASPASFAPADPVADDVSRHLAGSPGRSEACAADDVEAATIAPPGCHPRGAAASANTANTATSASMTACWNLLLDTALTPGDHQALAAMSHVRSCREGAAIVRQGEHPGELLAVVTGAVGVGRNRIGLADRHMATFHPHRAVHGPGWLDLHSAWLGQPHAVDICAISASTLVLAWPLAVARDWLHARPHLMVAMLRAMAAEVAQLDRQLHGLVFKDAISRVADWLMQQAGSLSELQLHERKRDVAAQLAMSPETFSRLMRQLENQGLVQVRGYRVTLLDRLALLRLSRGTMEPPRRASAATQAGTPASVPESATRSSPP